VAVEHWHGSCRQIVAGGLPVRFQSSVTKHYSAWGRCLHLWDALPAQRLSACPTARPSGWPFVLFSFYSTASIPGAGHAFTRIYPI
jgi:hypothetical protein